METDSWKSWIQEQDQTIRQGNFRKVRQSLRSLVLKRIPREHVADVANLARRVQMYNFILRLLHPIVRAEPGIETNPSIREIAYYAISLSRLGVYREANQLFETFQTPTPEIMLLQASNLSNQWNYEKALVLYEKLANQKGAPEYSLLIAQLNLAASEAALGRFQKAKNRLLLLIPATKNLALLQSNVHEVIAQTEFLMNDYESCQQNAKRANLLLEESSSRYSFYAKKWQVLSDCFAKKNLTPDFFQLKKEVIEFGEFEVLRDMDLFSAVLTKNENLFSQVILGTPFESYRRRATNLFPQFKCAEQAISGDHHPELVILDKALSCVYSPEGLCLPFRGKKAILMRALMKDFYLLQPIGTLFSTMCPDEIFNFQSSPNRIRKMISLLNQDLLENNLSVQIVAKGNRFAFSKQNVSWLLRKNQKDSTTHSRPEFRIWLSSLNQENLTRQDLENQFGLSKSTANRWIQKGLQDGLLKPGAFESKTRFKIAKASAA